MPFVSLLDERGEVGTQTAMKPRDMAPAGEIRDA